jgi:hypothetical protein
MADPATWTAIAAGTGAAGSLYSAYKSSRPKPGGLGGPGGAGYQPPQEDRIGAALGALGSAANATEAAKKAAAVPNPSLVQQPVPQSGQQLNPLVVGNPASNKTQPWQQQQDPYAAIGGNRTIADSLGYRRY